MQKLLDNDLKNITGGYIFNANGIIGADKDKPWELLNEKGDVIERYSNKDEAIYNAGKKNEKYMEINWEQVLQLIIN